MAFCNRYCVAIFVSAPTLFFIYLIAPGSAPGLSWISYSVDAYALRKNLTSTVENDDYCYALLRYDRHLYLRALCIDKAVMSEQICEYLADSSSVFVEKNCTNSNFFADVFSRSTCNSV
jgi:hypothetical protein